MDGRTAVRGSGGRQGRGHVGQEAAAASNRERWGEKERVRSRCGRTWPTCMRMDEVGSAGPDGGPRGATKHGESSYLRLHVNNAVFIFKKKYFSNKFFLLSYSQHASHTLFI